MAFSRSACGTCLFERALFLFSIIFATSSWADARDCARNGMVSNCVERANGKLQIVLKHGDKIKLRPSSSNSTRYSVAFNIPSFSIWPQSQLIRSDGIFYFHQIAPFSSASSCIVISMRKLLSFFSVSALIGVTSATTRPVSSPIKTQKKYVDVSRCGRTGGGTFRWMELVYVPFQSAAISIIRV